MSVPARNPVLFIPALAIRCASGPSGVSYDSPIGEWREKSEKSSGGTITSRLTIIDEASARYSGSFTAQVEFHAADDQSTWKGYWIAEGHTSCPREKGGSRSWGTVVDR